MGHHMLVKFCHGFLESAMMDDRIDLAPAGAYLGHEPAIPNAVRNT